jgi:sugar (pentulose or hexulose) kinase
MLIAYDLGTTGNKASLLDNSGRMLAAATADYPTHYAADTTSEQDPLRGDADAAGIDVIGGGAASDTWLALLADIWGVAVRRRCVTTQANSLGAAVTDLVGIGETDFSVAASIWRVYSVFLPSVGKLGQGGHLARFTDAYRALRVWFADAQGGIV